MLQNENIFFRTLSLIKPRYERIDYSIDEWPIGRPIPQPDASSSRFIAFVYPIISASQLP